LFAGRAGPLPALPRFFYSFFVEAVTVPSCSRVCTRDGWSPGVAVP